MMSRLLLSILACTVLIAQGQAASIVIEGFYQGKDLYVKNPTGPKGVGFSVYEVQVNGEITSDEINSSAFIVDLHILGMDIGDPITVTIHHHDESNPKVLNADAVLPQSTFEMISIDLDNTGTLKWQTKMEMGELPYKVQQYKWNKWITVGEVDGLGRLDENTYSFNTELHSGRNTFRLAQKTANGKLRYSDQVHITSDKVISLQSDLKKVGDEIRFSQATQYEIFDAYGRMIKRGYDDIIEVKKMDDGVYYLNYDKSFGSSFNKK